MPWNTNGHSLECIERGAKRDEIARDEERIQAIKARVLRFWSRPVVMMVAGCVGMVALIFLTGTVEAMEI